jgi:hypothetical protein
VGKTDEPLFGFRACEHVYAKELADLLVSVEDFLVLLRVGHLLAPLLVDV